MKSVPKRGSVGSTATMIACYQLEWLVSIVDPTLPRFGTDFMPPEFEFWTVDELSSLLLAEE